MNMNVGLNGPAVRKFGPYPIPVFKVDPLGFVGVGADPIKYIGDTLRPGRGLHVNEGLKSRNGRVRVFLQADGNFVLYGDGRALWWTGVSPGVNYVVMQTDGNFVVYKNYGKPGAVGVWDTNTVGRTNAYVVAQDDGNLVLYWGVGGSALWSSETNGFKYYGGPGKAISLDDVLEVAGEVIAVAQVVVSFVPGVGAGINAAIAAGAALAKGENITDAMAEAAKNALPGGPVAAQAFDAAVAAGKALARGENIGEAALAATREALPSEEAKRAYDVGLAIAHGQNVQAAIVNGATSLAGKAAAALAPAALPDSLTSIAKSLPPETTRVATAIFNRPELHGQSTAAIAKATSSDVATVEKATQAVGAAWQTLATLTPAQQKSLAAWATLSTLTPQQQKDLVALAKQKPPALKEAPRKPPALKEAPMKTPPTAITRGTYAPYPKHTPGAVSGLDAPIPHHMPHHGGGHRGSFRHPAIFRGGREIWGAPWATEIVTTAATCRTWGDPISIPEVMQVAAKVAIGASQGRPTTLRGDDGVLYLISRENGMLTARRCVAMSVT